MTRERPSTSARPETPAAFVRSILRAYERDGKSPSNALSIAQIAPSDLGPVQARVTADQFERLAAHAMRELDDEALGWFSRKLCWGANGMLCRASLGSADLRVALARWCRHYGLLVEDIRVALTTSDGSARLVIHEHAELGEQRAFCLVSVLRNVLGFACWLIDSNIPLTHVHLPLRDAADLKAYEIMFRCPVRLGEPHASLAFDAGYLALAIRRSDADLCQMLERPLSLVVHQYRRDRLLSQRVRHLLRTSRQKTLTAAALADAMHISTRSLYRHLADESTSLQRLKDSVRCELAMQALATTERPLKAVAAASGFGNEASFSRAFRHWTGMSPGEFRAARRAQSPCLPVGT